MARMPPPPTSKPSSADPPHPPPFQHPMMLSPIEEIEGDEEASDMMGHVENSPRVRFPAAPPGDSASPFHSPSLAMTLRLSLDAPPAVPSPSPSLMLPASLSLTSSTLAAGTPGALGRQKEPGHAAGNGEDEKELGSVAADDGRSAVASTVEALLGRPDGESDLPGIEPGLPSVRRFKWFMRCHDRGRPRPKPAPSVTEEIESSWNRAYPLSRQQIKLLLALTSLILGVLVAILLVTIDLGSSSQVAPAKNNVTGPLTPTISPSISPTFTPTPFRSSKSKNSKTFAPTVSRTKSSQTITPTAPATVSLDTMQTMDSILRRISSPSLLLAQPWKSNVQAEARHWMLYDDLLRDDVLALGAHRVTQRYVVCNFFMSVYGNDQMYYGGDNSTFTPQDLASSHECDWPGVACVESGSTVALQTGFTDDTSEDDIFVTNTSKNSTTDNATETTSTTTDRWVFRLYLQSDSTLNGTLPTELVYLKHLRELSLSNISLRGTIPNEWFQPLHYFYFDNKTSSNVTINNASITSNRGGWSHLYWLDLSENALTGTIPSALWTMPELRFLYLNSNRFMGSLPASQTAAGNVTDKLHDVWLFDNALTGPLPDWIDSNVSQPELEHWIAFENFFSGSLPSHLPPVLTHFDMSDNNLTGAIPEIFLSGEDNQLQFLYLDHNQLTGTLPRRSAASNGTTASPMLRQVWLNDNHLEGSIPAWFALSWRHLQKLRLQQNHLTGALDAAGNCRRIWPNLTEMATDCNVTCPCCTSCLSR